MILLDLENIIFAIGRWAPTEKKTTTTDTQREEYEKSVYYLYDKADYYLDG